MRRRIGFVMALILAAWPALWGCAGGPPSYRDPEWPGYTWGGRSEEQTAEPSRVQQQLALLTAQLFADLRARQGQRLAVLPFENTTGANPELLGAYLTEKITNQLYAERVGTVVERTYLKKVVDEIERGYSGPFDPLSLQEIGHLLNADTLILGSYTRLANGTTEVMARAVSVETGEIVGASSTMISGKIVPNAAIVVREPLLANKGILPTAEEPTLRPQERRLLSQAEFLGPDTPGTLNIVPSPDPGMVYSTPQFAPASAYPTYPMPQVVVPSYNSVPRTVVPSYSTTSGVLFPSYGFRYSVPSRPHRPFSVLPYLSQPRPTAPSSSRPSGHRHSMR